MAAVAQYFQESELGRGLVLEKQVKNPRDADVEGRKEGISERP